MKQTRKKYSAAFKAQVVIEALKERETLPVLAERFGVHATMISNWKSEFLSRSAEVFSKGVSNTDSDFEKERETMYAKIGKLEMERDFLKKSWNQVSQRKKGNS